MDDLTVAEAASVGANKEMETLDYWKDPTRSYRIGDAYLPAYAVSMYRNGSADIIDRVGPDEWHAWHLRNGFLSNREKVRRLVYDTHRFSIDKSYA